MTKPVYNLKENKGKRVKQIGSLATCSVLVRVDRTTERRAEQGAKKKKDILKREHLHQFLAPQEGGACI